MENCIYCGKLFEEGQTTCPKCGWEVKEYRSIENYDYRAVPTGWAGEILQQKAGLLTKGDMKKLSAAVEKGKVEATEIVIDKIWFDADLTDEDSERKYKCVNISDTEGNPAPEGIRVPDNLPLDKSEQAMLVRYMLKKEWIYVVLNQDTYQNFPANAKDIVGMVNLNTVDRELPVMEGSIADKGMKLLSGLFGRKKK